MTLPSVSATDVVNAIAGVSGEPAPLHAPEFRGNEAAYVKACIDTEWVSTAGEFVERFEADLAEFTGAKHVIATASGTAALHVCLLLAGVSSADEVLAPSLTFVATANAIAYTGAIPHFVDCEFQTLGVDPDALAKYLDNIGDLRNGRFINRKTGRRIAALIVMHTFGHPCRMEQLLNVCDQRGIMLIEDAAESLGSRIGLRHTGTFAPFSAMSFNGNKIVTTGGGGAILCMDDEHARRARSLTTTAKVSHPWEFIHETIAYNYRLPNLNAALGCAQLEVLSTFLEEKRRVADAYVDTFAKLDDVTVMREPQNCVSNYWLNVLLLNGESASMRDDILKQSNDRGIMTRPAWRPMHMLDMYKACPQASMKITEQVYSSLINIPSSPRLSSHLGNC